VSKPKKYLRYAYLVGKLTIFPSNGDVGGPGGKPGSLVPTFLILKMVQAMATRSTVPSDWRAIKDQ